MNKYTRKMARGLAYWLLNGWIGSPMATWKLGMVHPIEKYQVRLHCDPGDEHETQPTIQKASPLSCAYELAVQRLALPLSESLLRRCGDSQAPHLCLNWGNHGAHCKPSAMRVTVKEWMTLTKTRLRRATVMCCAWVAVYGRNGVLLDSGHLV